MVKLNQPEIFDKLERGTKMKKFSAILSSAVLSAVMLSGCARTNKTINSAEDLAGATIAVQMETTGDAYASALEEPEDGKEPARIERFDAGADAVNALKQGKVDCVIIDDGPAQVYVQNNSDLKILPDAFADEEYAIAVKKGNTELTEKLNAALEELESDGTLQKIVDNYTGDETKGSFVYTSPADIKRENGTLVMATNAQFPPYEMVENGNIVGIDADMMRAVCDKLGMELEIEDMKFDEIITAVKQGKVDVGVAAMTVDESRLKEVDFTRTYAKGKQVIIVKK